LLVIFVSKKAFLNVIDFLAIQGFQNFSSRGKSLKEPLKTPYIVM